MKSWQKQSSFDDAQALFGRMSGEAHRLNEVEKRKGRNRSPFVKLLLALTIASCLAAAAAFAYGLYAFPDAPLRKSYAGFANKQHLPRSEEDFRKFKIWEKAMFTSFGAAFVFGFSFLVAESRERRRLVR